MITVFDAVVRALRDLARPRVLAILVLPMLGAILLWSVLAWWFWDAWTAGLKSVLEASSGGRWLAAQAGGWLAQGTAVLIVVALLVPAVLVTAIVITELFAMPLIVSEVAHAYPGLERRAGASVAGSLANAAAAVSIFALLWLVTLPLWLTGIGAIVLPAVNSAYLNQRLFRYDALAEHAGREERERIVAANKGRLYTLGLILAPLYYLPVVNLAAPVLSGLAFTHLCLAELARQRQDARPQ